MMGGWQAPALGTAAFIKSELIPYERFLKNPSASTDASLIHHLFSVLNPGTVVYDYALLLFVVPSVRAHFRLHANIHEVKPIDQASSEVLAYFEYIGTYLQRMDFSIGSSEEILDEADLYLLVRHYAKADSLLKRFIELHLETFNLLQVSRSTLTTPTLFSRDPQRLSQVKTMSELRIEVHHYTTETACFPTYIGLPTSELTIQSILQAQLDWIQQASLTNHPDMVLLHALSVLQHVAANAIIATHSQRNNLESYTVNYSH
jgi:hypothetical protein